jgi:hypothetical protein
VICSTAVLRSYNAACWPVQVHSFSYASIQGGVSLCQIIFAERFHADE